MIRSFPYDRIITTRQDNPRLASQAPNVTNTNIKYNSISLTLTSIINTRVRIKASNANKDINKWRRWITKAINALRDMKKIDAVPKTNITWRIYNSTSDLQDQRFY